MLRLLTVILTIVVLFSCGKKGSEEDKKKETSFSFDFNGTSYKQSANSGVTLLNDTFGILIIDRPDLFGGTIYYHYNSSLNNNCAYLSPTGQQVYVQHPGCIVLNSGNPIDSVKVYLYRSGNLSITKSNCRRMTERAYGGSGGVEYDLCDVSGTFNLTLGNKNNQTIVITNGSFIHYDVRF